MGRRQRWVDGLRAQLQSVAGMHRDMDEDLVVAITEGESAPLVVAPLQLPSGMALWVRVRLEDIAAPAPAPLAVTPDHVDLAAASPGAPPNPAHGAWERLASRRLPRDLRALGWRILHIVLHSDVFLARVNPRRVADCVCWSSPACSTTGTYEMMQHLFFDCPYVAAVTDWLAWVWLAISPPGFAAQPRSVALLLAARRRPRVAA